ncbi:hypothetical protein DEV91_12665 [Phyllobacterium brassicacearum]|nr:hypothetical protein DEV91_12665 [Phyllobacterium brassicacearum]
MDDISTEERAPEPVRDPDTGHVISSVIAAALCMKPRLLTNRQARKVDALKKGSEAFAKMRTLAMRFSGILRSRNASALDEWIDNAIETNLIAIMRFASAAILITEIEERAKRHQFPYQEGSTLNASGINYGMLRQQEALKRLNELERLRPQ